jgi:hypothetical protein
MIAVLAILGAVAAGFGLRALHHTESIWAQAARRLGGEYRRRGGRSIVARVDGVELVLDEGGGAGVVEPITLARIPVRAHTPIDAPGFELVARPQPGGVIVESNRPALAEAWLHGGVREAIAPTYWACFSVRAGFASAVLERPVAGADELIALAHAAAHFARGGRLLHERWCAAATALGASHVADFAFEVVAPGGLVRVAADPSGDHVELHLQTARGASATERLDRLEPDLGVWRAAIARLVAAGERAAPSFYR